MLNFAGQRALILAPHADDETIGCGGVIQKYLGAKSEVRVVITSFITGDTLKYHPELGRYEPYTGTKRWDEVKHAMELLGILDYHVLYLGESEQHSYHSRLDMVARHELVQKIESHITSFKPTILYIPSVTKHQDHEALHKAALTAARPYFWNQSVVAYETDGEFSFQPNLFVALTEAEVERKTQALSVYKTQLGASIHPTTVHYVLVKAQFRGQAISMNYAEAFEVIRLHAGT